MQVARDKLVIAYNFWEHEPQLQAYIGKAIMAVDGAQRMLQDKIEAGKRNTQTAKKNALMEYLGALAVAVGDAKADQIIDDDGCAI